MNIQDRLAILRAQLKLSSRAFGQSIHLSGSSIINMEKGRRGITERTIQDICNCYHVRREWLADGTGPVFQDPLDGLAISEEAKRLAAQYARLNEKDQRLIRTLIDSLLEKEEGPGTQPPGTRA